jgi:hypothetical protein
MCVISGKIEKVANTNILCGLSEDKTRQIIVYSNTVNNLIQNNAMILPVPSPQSLMFHDLSGYAELFADCKNCFYSANLSRGGGTYSSNSFGTKKSKLEVFNVGSYRVSVAQNFEDLERVDDSVFTLSGELTQFLKSSYGQQWGYIICQLKRGSEQYHPFGYSHDIYRGKIFVPTKHYHVHGSISPHGNSYSSLFATLDQAYNTTSSKKIGGTQQFNGLDTFADDWSHDIYFYDILPLQNNEIGRMNKSTQHWSGSTFKIERIDFPFSKRCTHFEKIEIDGVHKNIDLIVPVY